MLSFITFLTYEAVVFFVGIYCVTHPSLQGMPAATEARLLMFMIYAVLCIGGMVEFIKSWTKD